MNPPSWHRTKGTRGGVEYQLLYLQNLPTECTKIGSAIDLGQTTSSCLKTLYRGFHCFTVNQYQQTISLKLLITFSALSHKTFIGTIPQQLKIV